MSKRYKLYKNFRKSHGMRGKLTFGDYKKLMHRKQKIEKRNRKIYLKAKSMLSQGREYVVIGNVLYYWAEDKEFVVSIAPDFKLTRRVFEMIKKRDVKEDSNG